MKRTKKRTTHFFRWVWVVYLPFVLVITAVGLDIAGLLPQAAKPLIGISGAWSLFAVRLLIEKRQRAVAVSPPKGLVVWFVGLALLLSIGSALFWSGANRLSTDSGAIMFLAGAFLLALAATAPLFKFLDLGLRALGRLVRRMILRSETRKETRQEAKPERRSQDRPARTRAQQEVPTAEMRPVRRQTG